MLGGRVGIMSMNIMYMNKPYEVQTGPYLWFDAADESTFYSDNTTTSQDDNYVGTWLNKGTKRAFAYVKNMTYRPTIRNLGNYVNGLNTLKFDKTPSALDCNCAISTDNLTCFCVYQWNTVGNAWGLYGNYNTNLSSDQDNIRTYVVNTVNQTSGANGPQIDVRCVRDSFLCDTVINIARVPYIHTVQFLKDTAACKTWFNGNFIGTKSILSYNTFAITNMLFGARKTSNTISNYGDITICELIFYNSVLTAAELNKIHNYLKSKWGVY